MYLRKYKVTKVKYDKFDFCITYIDDLGEKCVFFGDMCDDMYNDLENGKVIEYLELDNEDIDSEYWNIYYKKV